MIIEFLFEHLLTNLVDIEHIHVELRTLELVVGIVMAQKSFVAVALIIDRGHIIMNLAVFNVGDVIG